MVIVLSMAAATSVSLLVYLTDIAEGLGGINGVSQTSSPTDGGDPQTILILGSDKRLGPRAPATRAARTRRSCCASTRTATRSRCCRSPATSGQHPRASGSTSSTPPTRAGGPKLTLKVVQQLTGLDINHVVNVNFTGFADAVDAIDCVYVDVDRRYYIPPDTERLAEIDIEAGYQRLCGFKALQYVRFRHDDNDLVRAARQQDFLREAAPEAAARRS